MLVRLLSFPHAVVHQHHSHARHLFAKRPCQAFHVREQAKTHFKRSTAQNRNRGLLQLLHHSLRIDPRGRGDVLHVPQNEGAGGWSSTLSALKPATVAEGNRRP